MIRRPPRSTQSRSSAASDVYKRQINTLMTVQKDKLDTILNELKRTCNNLIVEMYDLPDFRCGWDLTTVKMNSIQWTEKLLERWKIVSFTQSKESKSRYIFICKDEVEC